MFPFLNTIVRIPQREFCISFLIIWVEEPEMDTLKHPLKLFRIHYKIQEFEIISNIFCQYTDMCNKESISNIKEIYFRKAITLKQASLALLLL